MPPLYSSAPTPAPAPAASAQGNGNEPDGGSGVGVRSLSGGSVLSRPPLLVDGMSESEAEEGAVDGMAAAATAATSTTAATAPTAPGGAIEFVACATLPEALCGYLIWLRLLTSATSATQLLIWYLIKDALVFLEVDEARDALQHLGTGDLDTVLKFDSPVGIVGGGWA